MYWLIKFLSEINCFFILLIIRCWGIVMIFKSMHLYCDVFDFLFKVKDLAILYW